MKWDDIPVALQEYLRQQYLAEVRHEFTELDDEIVATFLETPDSQERLDQYRELCWQEHLLTCDEYFEEWLYDHGLEP